MNLKKRYSKHLEYFRDKAYRNETELSKHVWELKEKKRDFRLKWSIVKDTAAYRNGARRCHICLEEKLLITIADMGNLLNK